MFHLRTVRVPFKATSFLDWNNDSHSYFSDNFVSLLYLEFAVRHMKRG